MMKQSVRRHLAPQSNAALVSYLERLGVRGHSKSSKEELLKALSEIDPRRLDRVLGLSWWARNRTYVLFAAGLLVALSIATVQWWQWRSDRRFTEEFREDIRRTTFDMLPDKSAYFPGEELRPSTELAGLQAASRRQMLIVRKAEELGLPEAQLAAALEEYLANPSLDGFELAIVRFFQGEVDEAEALLRAAITSSNITPQEGYWALGNLLSFVGSFDEAREAFEELLTSDPQDFRALTMLGLACLNVADYDCAQSSMEKSVELRRALLPEGDPELAEGLRPLGRVYKTSGEFRKAEASYLEAIALQARVVGRSLASTLNNLAQLKIAEGNFGEGEALHQVALGIRRAVLRKGDPEVANSLNNLGEVLRLQDRCEKALPFYEEARNIFQEALHELHPLLATTLNNLGLCLFRLAQETESAERLSYAEETLLSALRIREKVLTTSHPETGKSELNLGVLYRNAGNHDEAEKRTRRGLAIVDRYEDLAEERAAARNNLCSLLTAQERYREANTECEWAVKLFTSRYGSSNYRVGVARSNLGYVYLLMGERTIAREELEAAEAILREQLGEEHWMYETNQERFKQL